MGDSRPEQMNTTSLNSQYEGFLQSLLESPTETQLLRRIGEVLLLGSAIAWGLLAIALLLVSLNGEQHLPVLASLAGAGALLLGWRYLPRQWPAAVPVMFQAAVVFVFIGFAVIYQAEAKLAAAWIVIWTACAICVLTLALGFFVSFATVTSGVLLLNLLSQWLHPELPSTLTQSMIGLAGSAVIGLVTHAVCFQMTRMSGEARQLVRLRQDMVGAFAHELSLPISAIEMCALRVGMQSPEAGNLWILKNHLYTLQLMLAERSRGHVVSSPVERTSLAHIVMAASSLTQRLANDRQLVMEHKENSAESRLVVMPAREAAAALAYFCREALMQNSVKSIAINANVEGSDTLQPNAVLRIAVERDSANARQHRVADLTGRTPLLALSEIRQRVHEAGGTLSIQPPTAQWLSATISLPAKLNDLAAASQVGNDDNAPRPYAGMRLLLIEDEELTRLLTARNLEQHGATITQAQDAATAFAALETNEFDLIVADLNLPDLSGEALIFGLRRYDATLPIIVVSIALGRVDATKLVAVGADQLLNKPLQQDELQHSIGLLRASGRLN